MSTKKKKNKKTNKSAKNTAKNGDAKVLVVVESPSKSSTIKKYLGKDYEVVASMGHIVDLPKSKLGVEVEDGYEPDYTVMKGKKKVITALKKAFKGKDKLVLAVDPDREGEAIGWHVASQLGLINLSGRRKSRGKNKDKELERIVFTEITKPAVQAAIKSPRKLDKDLFNAQQSRRILDRLVGYKLSPLLWKKIRYGLSAGRVQSVAVKIIVDREKERDEFKPEEYWNVVAFLLEKKTDAKSEKKLIKSEDKLPEIESGEIKFDLVKFKDKKVDFKAGDKVKDLLSSLEKESWKISEIKKKETNRYPKPPFTTSTMQQTAANWFGFSAKRTMMAAQKLYEAGLITYMRTDSTNMSSQAVAAARKYIENTLSDKYIPEKPKYYKTKAKVAQEAHEAIRPSDFKKKPSDQKFSGRGAKDQEKLYQLIWQRALASQMSNAKVENISIMVDHDLSQGKTQFKANGQRILFKGYLEIYPEKFTEAILPVMKEGQEIFLNRLFGTQHFTQPPARYSEATLIKQLEKYGIGRPSTYAPIISTIQQRKYVEKEGKYFRPTDTGKVVTRLLTEHFPQIVDLDFTAGMEDALDEIATGEVEWKEFLAKFYEPFEKKLKKKEKEIEREDFTVMGDAPKDIKCPECGGKMLIKLGRYGKFYSCAKFPDCKGMLGLDGETPEEVEAKAKTDKFKEYYKPAPKTEDGRDYILKKGRFGEFWAHPDYPKVKDAKPLEYKDDKLEELFGEAPETKDGRKYVFRTGRYGKFWAHPDYPKVKKTKKIKKNPKIEED